MRPSCPKQFAAADRHTSTHRRRAIALCPGTLPHAVTLAEVDAEASWVMMDEVLAWLQDSGDSPEEEAPALRLRLTS